MKRMVGRRKGERKERRMGKVNRLGLGRKKEKRLRERREGERKKERKRESKCNLLFPVKRARLHPFLLLEL